MALEPGYPSYPYVTLDKGRRNMQETLRSKCLQDVERYLNENGDVERGTSEATISSIHTDIVQESIITLAPNNILNRQPPPIDPSKNYLPRIMRSTLSQLPCGHCARLQSYQHKIGSSPNDLCPECNARPHTTSHLFQCTAHLFGKIHCEWLISYNRHPPLTIYLALVHLHPRREADAG